MINVISGSSPLLGDVLGTFSSFHLCETRLYRSRTFYIIFMSDT